ncbi:MAG: amidohydrolase family protein [Actinomycetia bacterium]|nr:amidohydrolase family protein [Actinomycetes bacterium]
MRAAADPRRRLDRHPELELILCHSGSLLPQLIGRIDYQFELLVTGSEAKRAPSESIRLLYTDAVCAWPPALANALAFFGDSRVMFGTDDPFWEPQRTLDCLEELPLSPERTVAIYEANARRAFNLS